MKLLVTGFEPFGKSMEINPTEEIVKYLANTSVEGVDLVTDVLRVQRYEGHKKMVALLDQHQPDAVLML
ncbi:MAG: hypothetical protein IIA65_09565, partial [Planctomycetes bacterium]|nr:hypothetical protein [Planctomycetota bacterium]